MEGLALAQDDDLSVDYGRDDLGFVDVVGIAGEAVCVLRAFARARCRLIE